MTLTYVRYHRLLLCLCPSGFRTKLGKSLCAHCLHHWCSGHQGTVGCNGEVDYQFVLHIASFQSGGLIQESSDDVCLNQKEGTDQRTETLVHHSNKIKRYINNLNLLNYLLLLFFTCENQQQIHVQPMFVHNLIMHHVYGTLATLVT